MTKKKEAKEIALPLFCGRSVLLVCGAVLRQLERRFETRWVHRDLHLGQNHRATLVERVNNKYFADKKTQADLLAKGPNVCISSVGVYKHQTGLQSPKLPLKQFGQ